MSRQVQECGKEVCDAKNGYKAKKEGHKKKIIQEIEDQKEDIMADVQDQKFLQYSRNFQTLVVEKKQYRDCVISLCNEQQSICDNVQGENVSIVTTFCIFSLLVLLDASGFVPLM